MSNENETQGQLSEQDLNQIAGGDKVVDVKQAKPVKIAIGGVEGESTGGTTHNGEIMLENLR